MTKEQQLVDWIDQQLGEAKMEVLQAEIRLESAKRKQWVLENLLEMIFQKARLEIVPTAARE
jgi:hypothetical protein